MMEAQKKQIDDLAAAVESLQGRDRRQRPGEPRLCWACGKTDPLRRDCPRGRVTFQRAVGKCPEACVEIGPVKMQCLLDTGAQVSTISEYFYRKYLTENGGHVRDVSQLIRISAAQGLDIPYVGYIELLLQIMGHAFENMGFLIVQDPVATPLLQGKKLVPGVIGSNIFRDVREELSRNGEEYLQELEAAGAHAWAHVLALYSKIRMDR